MIENFSKVMDFWGRVLVTVILLFPALCVLLMPFTPLGLKLLMLYLLFMASVGALGLIVCAVAFVFIALVSIWSDQ